MSQNNLCILDMQIRVRRKIVSYSSEETTANKIYIYITNKDMYKFVMLPYVAMISYRILQMLNYTNRIERV